MIEHVLDMQQATLSEGKSIELKNRLFWFAHSSWVLPMAEVTTVLEDPMNN
jgi:hypothetical protein